VRERLRSVPVEIDGVAPAPLVLQRLKQGTTKGVRGVVGLPWSPRVIRGEVRGRRVRLRAERPGNRSSLLGRALYAQVHDGPDGGSQLRGVIGLSEAMLLLVGVVGLFAALLGAAAVVALLAVAYALAVQDGTLLRQAGAVVGVGLLFDAFFLALAALAGGAARSDEKYLIDWVTQVARLPAEAPRTPGAR